MVFRAVSLGVVVRANITGTWCFLGGEVVGVWCLRHTVISVQDRERPKMAQRILELNLPARERLFAVVIFRVCV